MRRWHGLVPAVVTLACLSCLWGATSLGVGYSAAVAYDLDDAFPVVVALRDGTKMEEAKTLAGKIGKQPGIRSARAVGADTALQDLLPADQGWAREIAAKDTEFIPPSLVVVVDGGVRDLAKRESALAAIKTSGGEAIDYIAPDGLDLSAARRRLEEAGAFISRATWIALLVLACVWLAFTLVDLLHFVFLVGRDQSAEFAGESLVLRRAWPTLLRGGVVALLASAAAAIALALSPLLLGVSLGGWPVGAAIGRAVAFALVAGVGGHAFVGMILWGHPHRPAKVSIKA